MADQLKNTSSCRN